MTGEGYFLLIMGVLIALIMVIWADDTFFKPKRETRPPVEKILELIKSEAGSIIVHNGDHLAPESVMKRQFVDYTIEDRITKKLTWVGRFPMHDTPAISGDFKWFNSSEAKRLYRIANKIGTRQRKEKNERASKERYERHEELRKKAEETYKYR
ncbi:hypothetical protein KASHIRA_01200 [Serratia phage vB_SmaM-Kashira]|nr:hypothetical protein KASHIRA_01200 [Serratia phage vB_SmaM-Kashira]